MINYNHNFLKFIYKNKNKRNYIEANIERSGLTKIRFLKPRTDFTSTKKIFEYKFYRIFNINTLFNNIEVYGKIKLELNNLGTYFKTIKIKKKKNKKSKLPWYITYNYIKCIQNYLFFKNKRFKKIKKIKKIKKFKIKTINYSYNKFKNIHLNIKKKKEYFYNMRFTKILTNFRNNMVVKRNFEEFIIIQKQRVLITTFRIKQGVFWGIFNLLNQIIKEMDILTKNWNINKVEFFIFEKYLILKSFIFYLTKLSFFTLKRASFRYLYFAKHLIIFFYNYLSNNIVLSQQNIILNKEINNDLFITEIPYNIEYKIFNNVNKNINTNKKKLFNIFNIYILFILNIEKKIDLFEDVKNNIKLNIDSYKIKKKGIKIPKHFLDFVIFIPYFQYTFKKLLTNNILKKKLKKKQILNLELNSILFNI